MRPAFQASRNRIKSGGCV